MPPGHLTSRRADECGYLAAGPPGSHWASRQALGEAALRRAEMSEATNTRTTRPAEGVQADLAGHTTPTACSRSSETQTFHALPTGGRVLSAMMLPYFTLRPPLGFGALTTTGRNRQEAAKCIHVIRTGNRAYIVMIKPHITAKASAWVLNIRADPNVSLRMRGGTFAGLARELDDDEEIQQARELYCGAVNPFDYVECTFHRGSRPTRAKIKEHIGAGSTPAPRLRSSWEVTLYVLEHRRRRASRAGWSTTSLRTTPAC